MWAISIRQPNASLIASGKKKYLEMPGYAWQRGPILIHASKFRDNSLFVSYDIDSEVLTLRNQVAPKKYRVPWELYVAEKCALCVVDLVNIKEFYDKPDLIRGACCDWLPNTCLWEFENVRLVERVNVKLGGGFIQVDDSLIKYL